VRLADLANVRVAIWGYGREGRATLAALQRRFPDKPLTLFCSEEEAQSAPAIAGVNIETAPPDLVLLQRFDVVIKSPGISPYKSPMPEAAAAGVRFTSGTALWFTEHPHARTICVTGTKGKSTVTALIAHLLRKCGNCVALAGNIGMPLLDLLDAPRQPDWWVIELSSFQTHDFDGAPSVAVINNLYEEHLDWHGTRERYLTDKLAIGASARALVVNAQPELLARLVSSPVLSAFGDAAGWHAREDGIWRGGERILAMVEIPLLGRHNAQNVCAALAALETAGEDARVLARHVATFKALPHRLQSLGVRDGLEFVNDSISTTPYATIEALRAFGGRSISVIVGGFDRGVDWTPFAEYVAQNAPRAIVATGANGARIVETLCAIDSPGFMLVSAPTLGDALTTARTLLPAGGVVLLSPGAPSFDQFKNYAERGREFARLAGFDPAAIAQIEGLGIA
jgi:UDP-N-acetylmuramoylalanine--D-glutamate ligase